MEGVSETYNSKDASYDFDRRNFMLFLSYRFSNGAFVALDIRYYILVFGVLLDCFWLQKIRKEITLACIVSAVSACVRTISTTTISIDRLKSSRCPVAVSSELLVRGRLQVDFLLSV